MSHASALNPDAVASDWRLKPSSVAWPGRSAGLCAAIFAGFGSDKAEFRSRPDPATHTLYIELSPFSIDVEIDGRFVHSGPVGCGDSIVVRAGEEPSARVTGDWRVVQFYLPAEDLVRTAEELGAPSGQARALELKPPSFQADRVLYRVARRLNTSLKRGDSPSRLELDEMGLVLSERLVRRHSNITLPRRRTSCLSDAETRIVLELLAHGADPSFTDLSALLDRPAAEVREAVRDVLRRRALLIGSLRVPKNYH